MSERLRELACSQSGAGQQRSKYGESLKMTYTSAKISVEMALELDVGVGKMEFAIPI